MNNRITAKERGLLKGAIRRVFSRSDLRKEALERQSINHIDPNRPRVKKWSLCPLCQKPTATYQVQVDHIVPIVPINSTLELMTWDDVINRTWCELENLQGICIDCHKLKTKAERQERNKIKKGKMKK